MATLIGSNGATLIGCVGCVVGAEALTENATGVWVKTRFYQQGHFLCATVYSVAQGEPKVFELKVDLRPIARALMRAHSTLHAKDLAQAAIRGRTSGTTVGWSLSKMWKGVKKVAKKIGRSKLVKGVVKVTKTVAKVAKTVIKSKVTGFIAAGLAAFPLTAPFGAPALAAYASANAAVSGVETASRVVQTARAAASTITQGAQLAKRVVSAKARTVSVVKTSASMMTAQQKAQVAKRTQAAARIKLNAKGKTVLRTALAKTPTARKTAVATALKKSLGQVSELRKRLVLAKSLPKAAGAQVIASTKLEMKAAPVIKKAAATARKLQDPKVRAQLVAARAQGTKAQAALQSIADRAKTGDLDAQKSAAIVNLVARNRARIQAMSQANAGGLPGLLITKEGKLRRGRFRLEAVANGGGVLYQGAGKPSERGAFTTVSGVTLESIAINGELPADGVYLTSRGPNSSDIGPYEVGSYELIGCGSTPCAPCLARAS